MPSPNTSPRFIVDGRHDRISFGTANSNLDGTGVLGDIITGAAQGTHIQHIKIKAEGVTTAGMIRLFVYDLTTTLLLKEFLVGAITPSAVVQSWEAEWLPTTNLILAEGEILRCSTENAETFTAWAFGGDL
ncbi:MAG: hypothetical protein QQN63_00585 [Nitrosopumilus sp.]